MGSKEIHKGLRMLGITVCVHYSDYLKLTLPINAIHFEATIVLSSFVDNATVVAMNKMDISNLHLLRTDRFYRQQAYFNKGAAIDYALQNVSKFSKNTEICLFDADVVIPANAKLEIKDRNCLYTPKRRMCSYVPTDSYYKSQVLYNSEAWDYPYHEEEEHAGYFQMFDLTADCLKDKDLYPTQWIHAGGCDTEFQNRFVCKQRPDFDVLHLGPERQNWCGRVTAYLDGSVNPMAIQHAKSLEKLLNDRQQFGHEHEQLSQQKRAWERG